VLVNSGAGVTPAVCLAGPGQLGQPLRLERQPVDWLRAEIEVGGGMRVPEE